MENWDWGRIALATVVAAVASSMTDWLFFGVLFHDKYLVTPEVWRSPSGGNETKKILLSSILGAISCGAFIVLCKGLHFNEYVETLKLAGIVWLIGSLPIVLTTQIYVKLHPALAVTHSLGYLVRLLVAAVVYVLIVH